LGVDSNGIYVTVVYSHMTNQQQVLDGQTVVAIKKPEIYLGTNWQTLLTNVGPNAWTIQPAVNFDSPPTGGYAWFVAKAPPTNGPPNPGGAIYYRRLQWSGTNAAWADGAWQPVPDPPSPQTYRDYYDLDNGGVTAPQLGGPTRIDLRYAGASRLMMAVIRDRHLWTCHHIGLCGTNGNYTGNGSSTNVDRTAIQ
jgi:hypothetical protein